MDLQAMGIDEGHAIPTCCARCRLVQCQETLGCFSSSWTKMLKAMSPKRTDTALPGHMGHAAEAYVQGRPCAMPLQAFVDGCLRLRGGASGRLQRCQCCDDWDQVLSKVHFPCCEELTWPACETRAERCTNSWPCCSSGWSLWTANSHAGRWALSSCHNVPHIHVWSCTMARIAGQQNSRAIGLDL